MPSAWNVSMCRSAGRWPARLAVSSSGPSRSRATGANGDCGCTGTVSVQIDESYEDAELRGILTGWQGPNVLIFGGLSAGPLLLAEASEVQAEFIRLLTRLSGLFEANRAAGRGQPFAVWGVLTPVNEAELVVFKS